MTTTKLSFRARALDAAKPMAVYMAHELPDLPDFTIINRAVPQMPTGMEKEEETEHHLQRAIVAGLIIPTPEVFQIDEMSCFNRCCSSEWKVPRNLIHMQPFTMEQDIPDYDMDSDDEKWMNSQADKLEITPLQFEEMMDRLEKSSGQTVITLNEAKSLLKQDDDLIIAVYDYWLNKRLKTLRPLIPQVKTEKFGGTASSANPYIAFRRRTEKMQTRKHRKNDEASYEKMLKLRRDLSRALTLLEMVKKREKFKREVVQFGIEVYEKRYQLSDYSGHIISEVNAQVRQQPRPSFTPLSTIQNSNVWPSSTGMTGQMSPLQPNGNRNFMDELLIRKERRNYRKRRHKTLSTRGGISAPSGVPSVAASTAAVTLASSSRGTTCFSDVPSASSEDEVGTAVAAAQSDVDEAESDVEKHGPFTFRRKLHCNYLPPASLPSTYPLPEEEEVSTDPRLRFSVTSLAFPKPRCIGFARRRIGRGGRMVLDRACSSLDGAWDSLNNKPSRRVFAEDLKEEIRTWKHFRPATPPSVEEQQDGGGSEGKDHPVDVNDLGCVSIYAEGEEDYQTIDAKTFESQFFDNGGDLDGFRIPNADCSPPTISHSNFSVIGDSLPGSGAIDLDWWDHFDAEYREDEAKGCSGGDAVCSANVNPSEVGGKKSQFSLVNGISSPSTATDVPFWKVPKTASLTNNDCSMANPCLGDLHSVEEDQTNQKVVDFLLIDSTFAMEVT